MVRGVLHERLLAVCNETRGLVFQSLVPGLVCDRCHEELIDRHVAREIERNQTPAIWFEAAPSTSRTEVITLVGGVLRNAVAPA